MSKKIKPLNRRTFLRGMGNTFLALPLLDIMLDSHGEVLAQSNTALNKKFVTMFSGTSISGQATQHFYPSNTGVNYDLPLSLQPIGTRGIQSEVTVVSNLTMPLINAGFHGYTVLPQICGKQAYTTSADQHIAYAIGKNAGKANYDRGIVATVQPKNYRGDRDFTISFDKSNKKIESELSPQALYNGLFGNFTPPNDTNAEAQKKRRINILDLVLDDYKRLANELGKEDQNKVIQHFDTLSDLQKKIDAIPPAQDQYCKIPNNPGPDPKTSTVGDGLALTGYSNEDLRANVMIDLIHLALICDLHRTASVMLTLEQCFLNGKEISPIQNFDQDIHELGHARPAEYLAYANRWQVDKYAMLIEKLKSTPEGAGTALDNSILIFFLEGGHEGGENGPHSTQNMSALISGGKNLNLNSGIHLRTNKAHPAKVFTTAMKAFGLNDTLGDVTGHIPELIKP